MKIAEYQLFHGSNIHSIAKGAQVVSVLARDNTNLFLYLIEPAIVTEFEAIQFIVVLVYESPDTYVTGNFQPIGAGVIYDQVHLVFKVVT